MNLNVHDISRWSLQAKPKPKPQFIREVNVSKSNKSNKSTCQAMDGKQAETVSSLVLNDIVGGLIDGGSISTNNQFNP